MSAKRPRPPETPAKRTSLASQSGRSPSVSTAAGSTLAADHGTFKLNAAYLADLDVAWQKVNTHPVFQGLPKLQTSPIGMQGLDIDQFNHDMSAHDTYTCGGNLFWADPFFTGTPGVPINRRGVCLDWFDVVLVRE